MDRDIDLIIFRYLLQAFVEVLHITDKKGTRKLKISFLGLVIINDVNHDPILQTDVVHPPKHRGT